MKELKEYYTAQTETQPDPSLTVSIALLPKREKSRPIRRAILIAATIAILTTTAFAVSPGLREAFLNTGRVFPSDDGITVETVIWERLPISETLRLYLETHDCEQEVFYGLDGSESVAITMYYCTQGFESYSEVAGFFGIDILHSPLLTESITRSYRNEVAKIGASMSYYGLNPEQSIHVNVNSEYLYGDYESNIITLSADFNLWDQSVIQDGEWNPKEQPSILHYQPDAVNHETYTSPVNGIEAVIGIININNSAFSRAIAVFTVSNIQYSVMAGLFSSDYSTAQTIDVLKEIIDSMG